MRRREMAMPSGSMTMRSARGDVVVVEQRLAHAHQHDVGEQALAARRRPLAVGVARHQDLADDLAGGQIAHQALRAGVAERAGQRAADLRGEAERAAILLGDEHGLRLVAVGEAQQPLARAVVGALLQADAGPLEREALREPLAQARATAMVMAAKSRAPRW